MNYKEENDKAGKWLRSRLKKKSKKKKPTKNKKVTHEQVRRAHAELDREFYNIVKNF